MDLGQAMENSYHEGYTRAIEDTLLILKIELEFAKEYYKESVAYIERVIDTITKELKG